MKLIKWKFRELEIPMVKTAEGELFCTTDGLCSALGLRKGHLYKILHDNGDELRPQVLTDCKDLKEFVRQNLVEMGLGKRQVQAKALIWSLDEALNLAYVARTSVSREFIKESIKLVKANATEHMVSREVFEAMERRAEDSQIRAEEYRVRFERLERAVFGHQSALDIAASAAGTALQAQRGTKPFREMN